MRTTGFELWDPETHNLAGSFTTKEEALEALAAAFRDAPAWARDLQLYAVHTKSGKVVPVEAGQAHRRSRSSSR